MPWHIGGTLECYAAAAAQVHSPRVHSSPGVVRAADGWHSLALSPDAGIAAPFHSVHTTMFAVVSVLPVLPQAALSSPGETRVGLVIGMTGACRAVFP